MKSALPARSQRWLIGLLMGLVTLTPMGIDIYLPSLPAMAAGFGQPISALQASITLFIFSVGVGQILIGPLADRYGRRLVALAAARAHPPRPAPGAAATPPVHPYAPPRAPGPCATPAALRSPRADA
ncbi:MFS transporter, partial [Achromobacter ruhlandii]|uniref:MFS transporter n=1 Tax=Achromobacter ruhlandii TaxID=72557 RepID=UPI00321192AD